MGLPRMFFIYHGPVSYMQLTETYLRTLFAMPVDLARLLIIRFFHQVRLVGLAWPHAWELTTAAECPLLFNPPLSPLTSLPLMPASISFL